MSLAVSAPILRREEAAPANGPQLLPLSKLGPREVSSGMVTFGMFLPWVSAAEGYRVVLKILHENDQFLQDIRSKEFTLSHSLDPDYGDFWSTPEPISIDPSGRTHFQSSWGNKGTYVYRYQIFRRDDPNPIDWIIDPYAREFGVGKMSAFTLGYEDYVWSADEAKWKTPKLNDLVVYELMINEFGGSIDGAISHLRYLADLGVNCIEIMPVANVAETVQWGYMPIGYFGVDDRFGNRKDFQKLVDVAHQNGIAVILDSVYGHTGDDFPYKYLYDQLKFHENPFMGSFAKDMFGASTDFNRKITRDFFFTVNNHWLEVYHADGFRYDCVPNYWDGPKGNGYASLTYFTYQSAKTKLAAGPGYWQRFANNDSINLIQCAEQLEAPVEVLNQSYSTCTWQDGTFGAAGDLAKGSVAQPPKWDNITRLGMAWGLQGFPTSVTVNGDTIAKSAFQHIENHDHSRFICNFGLDPNSGKGLFAEGNRELWYKLQPYIIGQAACKGIPLLWQGQEFGEDHKIPTGGVGRVLLFRTVRWDYFYDDHGQSLIRLFRKMLALRNKSEHFRSGDHFFYNDWDKYQSKGLMLFSRSNGDSFSLIALNFSDQFQNVPFWFPKDGNYVEELHGQDNKDNVKAGTEQTLALPSNYGRIWTLS
jgi:maltooligosyltrehalose trehalohydrolase